MSPTTTHSRAIRRAAIRHSAMLALVTMATFACMPKSTSSNAADSTSQATTSTNSPTRDSTANPWNAALARGVVFRAIGQEPGWLVDVDTTGALHVTANYGTVELITPPSHPTIDSSSGRVTYHTTAGPRPVALQIDYTACHDAMSGEPMPYTVALTLDTTTWHGCGRLLDTRGLTNVYWKLTQLDTDTVIANQAREPYIRFTSANSRFAGSTGCNRMSGTYTVSNDRLTLSQAISTKMACLDNNVMQQEQRFLTALQTIDRFAVKGDSLVLYQNDQPRLRFVAVYLR